MSGPLSNPTRRRRNKLKIPTRTLPAEGYAGPIPKCPYSLGSAGKAWWRWAWRTPQAAAWSDGELMFIAKRATLEDDLASLGQVDNLDALDLLDSDTARQFKELISRLAALATGRTQIQKQMTEIDSHLGLTTKGWLALHFEIVETIVEDDEGADEDEARQDARRQRLTAVAS